MVAWVLFCGWAATISILSSLSGQDLKLVPGNLLQWDKVIHALAFGAGALLLTLALHGSAPHWSKTRLAITSLLGMALCGTVDEYHQMFSPGRSGWDFRDWLADMIGSMIVISLYYYFYERINGPDPAGSRKQDPPPAN